MSPPIEPPLESLMSPSMEPPMKPPMSPPMESRMSSPMEPPMEPPMSTSIKPPMSPSMYHALALSPSSSQSPLPTPYRQFWEHGPPPSPPIRPSPAGAPFVAERLSPRHSLYCPPPPPYDLIPQRFPFPSCNRESFFFQICTPTCVPSLVPLLGPLLHGGG